MMPVVHVLRGAMAAALALALVQCSSSPGEPATHATTKPPAQDYPPLVNEAGFVDVPPQEDGARYSARMFYAFHPAETDARGKPLFVFFNGGPGFATTSGLMAYGTGPMTLVDGSPPGTQPQPNPATFARFANLLYIDERIGGFSYALRSESAATPDFGCQFDPIGDASDFARVILTFLEGHAALRAAPVVLVGESYGGARATALLHLLFHYADHAVPLADDLRASIREHYEAIFPAAHEPFATTQIAKQFGGFVLIQPLVLGGLQYGAQELLAPKDPYIGPRYASQAYDTYDLSKPSGWSTTLETRAAAALGDEKGGAALVGVDLDSIGELLPHARQGAVRLPLGAEAAEGDPSADDAANRAIAARLGALTTGDYYFATAAPSCTNTANALQDGAMGDWFLDDLRSARLFLTHARWDGAIYVPAIPYALQQANIPTRVDTDPRTGFARPGWIRISIADEGSSPAAEVEVRYPSYDSSGHMVAVSQGADLADDVEQWLGALSL
jgi:serine carboxypeptidase